MAPIDSDARPSMFRTRTIQGTPYKVGGQKLVPVARVVTMGRARGTVGANSVSAWAGGFYRIVPAAILVRTEMGDRRIEIVDATRNLIGVFLAVGLISTVILTVVRRIARRLR